jgi:uncharacterized membrane protein
MLGAAGYIIIAAMIAAPFLQEYYNLTRLSLQMLVVLGLASIIGAAQVLKRFGHNGTFITAAMIALSLFASVGLTGIWSGKLQTIELATQADAKDKYYVTDPEAAAATWLKTLRPGTTVYADALAALQLQAYANITTYDTVVLPSITSRDSYVYVDSANLNRQTGYLEYDNNTLTYNFPLDFLDEQKDIIYSNNSARVYH